MRALTLPAVLALATLAPPARAQDRAPAPPPGDSFAYLGDVVLAARHDFPAIRACYGQAAGGSRRAWSRVRALSLVLAADGAVSDLGVQPLDAGTGRFRACMLPIVRAWRLHAPRSGAPVTLTYNSTELRLAIDPSFH